MKNNLYTKLNWKNSIFYVINNEKRKWETKAMILYKDNLKFKKAVAAGKAIDGALNKEKSKF